MKDNYRQLIISSQSFSFDNTCQSFTYLYVEPKSLDKFEENTVARTQLLYLKHYNEWSFLLNCITMSSSHMQVFIMGFGNIGIHLAKRLRPFGVKVIATKRSWVSRLQNSCGSGSMKGVETTSLTSLISGLNIFFFFLLSQNYPVKVVFMMILSMRKVVMRISTSLQVLLT